MDRLWYGKDSDQILNILQDCTKKFLLGSVRKVLFGLMGLALAAFVSGQE